MKDGDVQSFFIHERKRLVAYVGSLLRAPAEYEAEDLVHDVFAHLLERRDMPASEYMVAYVYRALRNRVIDYGRKKRATVSLDVASGEYGSLIDLVLGSEPDATGALQHQDNRDALFKALDTLSQAERDVVIAHEFEGTSFRELAVSWGIPQNTLLSHKARAMKKLKQYFLTVGGNKL